MERRVFKLTDAESCTAMSFRMKHKRDGCLLKNFIGILHREVQTDAPNYSYIFRQKPDGTFIKYIQCNFCGEQKEITEK